MCDLVTALMTWVALQIGCPVPAPPCIEQVSAREIADRFYGGDVPPGAKVLAIYDRNQRVVYLSTAWRQDSIADRSTLLHELVHHLQETAGFAYACAAAREGLAYHLQAKWLRENGVDDAYRSMGVDEFTISVRSLCLPPE